MIARRLTLAVARAITAWWQDRPTQRRLDKLKARRIELKGRIEVARAARNTALLHSLYPQFQSATAEQLRLERRRIA